MVFLALTLTCAFLIAQQVLTWVFLIAIVVIIWYAARLVVITEGTAA